MSFFEISTKKLWMAWKQDSQSFESILKESVNKQNHFFVGYICEKMSFLGKQKKLNIELFDNFMRFVALPWLMEPFRKHYDAFKFLCDGGILNCAESVIKSNHPEKLAEILVDLKLFNLLNIEERHVGKIVGYFTSHQTECARGDRQKLLKLFAEIHKHGALSALILCLSGGSVVPSKLYTSLNKAKNKLEEAGLYNKSGSFESIFYGCPDDISKNTDDLVAQQQKKCCCVVC